MKNANLDFINISTKVHSGKYSYKNILNKINGKIEIICPEHGSFFQRKYDHKKGDGCPKCSKYKKLTKEHFIKRGNIIHNSRYDYTESVIGKSKDKVRIICKIHGPFYQTPETHLNSGCGCSKCKNKHNYSTDEFITKANEIYKYKYDYSSTKYVRANTKVKIICPEHGEFLQLPTNHLHRLGGCPLCSNIVSKGEQYVIDILEYNKIKYIYQKRFEGCKNKQPLPFDFYLPDYNICIEYDGIQHFKPVEFFGGKKAHMKTKINDLIKDQYCDDNNIKLIRINYKKEINENINN